MTSSNQDPEQAVGESGSAEWGRSTECYAVPTLIVLCGPDLDDLKDLRHAVSRRLQTHVEMGSVRWLEWAVDRAGEPGVAEEITAICEPLLSLSFWQHLVDMNHWPELPAVGSRPRLQLVVVYDAQEAARQAGSQWLEEFAADVEKALGGRAEYSLVLLLLDSGSPIFETGQLKAYWPRLRLSRAASGGTRVDRGRLLQVCQHVLVGLVTSELGRAIEHVVGRRRDSVGWIALGAAAVVVDLPTMQEQLRWRVFRGLLESLVVPSCSETQMREVEERTAVRAKALQSDLLHEASRRASGVGWQIDVEKQEVWGCRLEGTELLTALFGPRWQFGVPEAGGGHKKRSRSSLVGGVRTLSPSNLAARLIRFVREVWQLVASLGQAFWPRREALAAELERHYRHLETSLERDLGGPASRGYEDLGLVVASFLDRGLVGPEEELPLSAVGDPLPTGLPTSVRALRSVVDCLSHDVDVVDMRDGRAESVRPALLASRGYWEAATMADADVVHGGALRYRRFTRTIASPLGVVLKLAPAWPLLTGLLNLLPGWSTGRSAAVAGVGLASVGVIELAYWWLLRSRRLLGRLQAQVHRCFSDRVLALLARVLRDYRVLLTVRLREGLLALGDLLTLLSREYGGMSAPEPLSESVCGSEEGSLYRLVDLRMVSEWTHEAVQDVRRFGWREELEGFDREVYDSAITTLIGKEVWPLAERPAPEQEILGKLEEAAAVSAQKTFRSDLLEVYTLAGDVEPLEDGRVWRWLWQRAQPLGEPSRLRCAPFCVVTTCGEAPLIGSTGRGSIHWRSDWLEAESCLTHELGCTRGVIEWL